MTDIKLNGEDTGEAGAPVRVETELADAARRSQRSRSEPTLAGKLILYGCVIGAAILAMLNAVGWLRLL